MNLSIAQHVQSVLTTDPQRGVAVAAAAGISFELAHHALAWLYDRGLATIARGPRGRIEGWVA